MLGLDFTQPCKLTWLVLGGGCSLRPGGRPGDSETNNYIYIYIYIERERETYLNMYIYIYIYTCIERERERERVSTPLKADHPERPTITLGWSL